MSDDDHRRRGQLPEPSGDPGHSEVPDWHLPRGFSSPYANEEAARMGLDRNTLEGAQLHFFSNLSPNKLLHKTVAWVALFLMFGLPLLLRLRDLIQF
ncbi:MAG: hypothetical protein M3Y66_05390 [Actinomycetota bacterium]|nr:hypothetical protein [Actinomycetota bacterium]